MSSHYRKISEDELEGLYSSLEILENIDRLSSNERPSYYLFGLVNEKNLIEHVNFLKLAIEEDEEEETPDKKAGKIREFAFSVPLSSDIIKAVFRNSNRLESSDDIAYSSTSQEGVRINSAGELGLEGLALGISNCSVFAISGDDCCLDEFLKGYGTQNPITVGRNKPATKSSSQSSIYRSIEGFLGSC